MAYKIHTLRVLRAEIKTYQALVEETERVTDDYLEPIRRCMAKYLEAEEKLSMIQSHDNGEGLSTHSSFDSDNKYNHLIDLKEELLKSMDEYVSNNSAKYLDTIDMWEERMRTVEYYLELMNAEDRKYINDLYVEKIGFRKVQAKYYIVHDSEITNKANRILKKVIRKSENT